MERLAIERRFRQLVCLQIDRQFTRGGVCGLDPGVPVTNVRNMREVAMSSISQPKVYAWVMGAFASVSIREKSRGPIRPIREPPYR